MLGQTADVCPGLGHIMHINSASGNFSNRHEFTRWDAAGVCLSMHARRKRGRRQREREGGMEGKEGVWEGLVDLWSACS